MFFFQDLKKYIFQPIVRYGDTDSIFTCYRFRENMKRIKDDNSIILWKEIVKFSKNILAEFITDDDNKKIWLQLHDTYYTNIVNLTIPKGPQKKDVVFSKNIIPLKERMEQFISEYMEELFLSWLWIMQDIFNKNYINDEVKNSMIQDRLFNNMNYSVDTLFYRLNHLRH